MVIDMNEHLVNLRDEKEKTQKEIALLLDTTQSNYNKWETGKNLPPLFHLNSLANYFNTSIDYLIGITNINIPTTNIDKINKLECGKKILELRKDNKLTQRELAKELNTSHSTLSAYESGKNLIIVSFALELSKKYNISLDWLCGRSNKKYIDK